MLSYGRGGPRAEHVLRVRILPPLDRAATRRFSLGALSGHVEQCDGARPSRRLRSGRSRDEKGEHAERERDGCEDESLLRRLSSGVEERSGEERRHECPRAPREHHPRKEGAPETDASQHAERRDEESNRDSPRREAQTGARIDLLATQGGGETPGATKSPIEMSRTRCQAVLELSPGTRLGSRQASAAMMTPRSAMKNSAGGNAANAKSPIPTTS
jgi:hypothetical protein